MDELPAELFKLGSEKLQETLHHILINASLVVGHKKGHRLECAIYREITLLNTSYKIMSRILLNRLRPLEKSFVGEYRTGFDEG